MSSRTPRFRRAVGLIYDERESDAPQVGVKGESFAADEIVKAAARYGVPVVSNPQLARALSTVDLDSEIPEHLFKAVAVLLSSIERKLLTGGR